MGILVVDFIFYPFIHFRRKGSKCIFTMHLCFLPRLTNFKGVWRLSRFLKKRRDPKAKTPDMKAPKLNKKFLETQTRRIRTFRFGMQPTGQENDLIFGLVRTFLDFLFFCFELNLVFEFWFL